MQVFCKSEIIYYFRVKIFFKKNNVQKWLKKTIEVMQTLFNTSWSKQRNAKPSQKQESFME